MTASPSHSWVKGNAVSQALPAATDGDGGVTYSIEESLPAGLSFAAATRTISGTPTAAQAATDYTLAATDADGDKGTLRFSLEIEDIAVSISSPSVAEGAAGATATLEYDVTLNRAPGRQVTVDWAAAANPGTASSGTDYTAITGGTLTFTAAQTSKTFEVTVTGDALDEPNETVRVALSNPSGAVLGSAATGVGTITDDDPTPMLTLALSEPDPGNPDTIDESGAGNATTVTASLSGGTSGEAITVTVSATDATAAAGDFSLSSARTLTIAAGATTSSGTVTVTAVDDTTDEPDETATVGGTVAGGHGLVAAPAGLTLTIADDDARPRSALALSPASISESAEVATVTATLSNPSAAAVTLTVSAAPVAPAMAGDFALSSARTLTIAAGETTSTGTVTVTAVGNTTDSADKSVTVSGTASGTLGAVDPPDATLTIRDDDGAPTVSLVLSSSSVSENGGVATVTAVLSGASSAATTITVSAAAGANAVSGDFTLSATDTLTIAAGQTASTGTVTITANDNAVGSPDKQVTVSGTASGGNGVAAPASLTLTLVDDEAAPTTRLTLSPASVGEANGVSTVTATLSGVSSEATTITVSAAAVSSSGADATDFTLSTAKTLTIAAGATTSTGTVTVTANPNTTDSADKQVTVSGTAAGGGGAESPSDATLTITDDDDAPTVTLSLSASTIDESGSGNSATVSATLSHPSSAATTVTVTPVASAYTVAPGAGATIVIAAGQTANAADTATITAVDDAIDNPADRTATVAGTAANSVAAANTQTVSVTGAALTLADDDTAGFALSPSTSASSPLGTTEGGGTATFSVKLASEPTGNVVLGVASSDTAEGTVSPSSLTFNATTWNTAQQVTLTGVDDSPGTSDGARPYTVTLTVNETSTEDPTYDGLSAVTVHAVNADDEHGLVVGSVTGQATEAGGQATFTVKLATEPAGDVTVAVTSRDASEGTVSPSSLTFTTTTWNTTQTVTVTGVDDAIDEGEVTWEVRLDPSSSDDTNYNGLSNVDVSVTTTDDDAAPTVSIDSPSVAEGTGATGGTLRFTVRLSTASGRQVTVDYADAGTGTATSGTDYTAITAGTLTFAVGTTSQTIDVAVTDDAADEPAETVEVTLSGPVNATLVAGASTGTGTVTDDDDAPTVSIDSPSVAEGAGATGGTLRFTVRLSAASGRQVTVDYADAGTGTATSGTDYTAITAGTLTFAVGTTSQTIDVAVTGDAADEPAETVEVTLSDPVNATLAAAATGTGTVTDDDAAPTVSIDSPSVAEGAAGETPTLRFTVRLSAASGRPVTVGYADAGSGTATSGTDYTALTTGTLTFAVGTTTQTIDVTVTGDALDEANETVEVTLSTPTNATLSSAATGTGTVTDDDAMPTVSINSPSVMEGTGTTGGTLRFTVTLSAASGRPVTVAYARTGGTATSGTDYTALSAGTLTFTAGTTTQTIDVTVTGDAADEPAETVAVTLSGPTNATLDTGTGTGTITDDDAAPTVSIDSPSVTEGTGATGGTLRFTVSLSAASGKQVTVAYADAGTGTATSGTDYTAITAGRLTFAVGTTTQTIDVTVTGDATDEADETVAVTLSTPTNATLAAAATGTGTVTDDDAAPTVSINSPSVTEGTGATSGTLRFTVRLSAASGKQVTVAYADAGTGTATSGTDYTAITSRTLTFAAGTTTQTVDVTVTGDGTDEQNETVAVTLSSPVNATLAVGAATGTGTVVDDDGAPTLTLDAPSVTEGTGATGGTLTFTVTLSPASAQQVTVNYADAGTGTATSGTDYTALTAGTLTFAAGTTTQTFDVSVTGDAADEADETVAVTLSGPTNATLGLAAGTGTITDDDDAPTVSIDSPSVTEGTGATATLRFTVTLSAASGKQVSVAYARTGGTATSGTDYTALPAGTLTFAVGTTTQTIDVTVTGDAAAEAAETVVVTLSAPVNANLATGAGTGTITDDDDAPTVSINSPSVAEGAPGTAATLRFTVSLSAASGRPVTVAYADAGTGTATAGEDYATLAAGTLTFAVGTTTRTIDVSVTGDGTDEQNETVVVTLSAPVNATLDTATGTGTVTDDDDAPTLSIDSPSVTEGTGATGGTLRFTVTLSAASGRQVTVAYADAGTGTATSGTDYTALTAGTLTFTAGTTTRTIDVTVTGDGTDEANETVAVTLSTPTNATLSAAATGTGTITDDDDAPTLSIDAPHVVEGATGETPTLRFTVRLSAASGKQVTVAYEDAGSGTATSGTDYTALTAGTLTFTAGTTSQTIDVMVTGDGTDEANETVAVTLSSPANATLAAGAATGTATGTGTVVDDDGAPTLTLDAPSVAEGTGATGGTLRFTVSLSAASGRPVRVAYARTGGTATAGAAGAPGTDYTALTAGTLTFAAGTTTRTIDVSVTGDAADEPDETVVVTLSAPVNATLATGAGTGTITDDDAAPTVSINSPSVTEGAPGTAATLRFTVSLSAASGRQVRVAYADAGTGTATSGEDYAALVAGTLTFGPGTTTRTIDVSVTGDAADEAHETVVVTLSAPVNATLAAGATTGTGTVNDDDARTLSIDSPIVMEGTGATGGTLTFTVSLSAASGRQVTVDYADAGTGTATSGEDYAALVAGTLTFAAGTTTRTIDVAVTGDATDEQNETVAVTLSSPVNAVLAVGAATGTGTIADDDGAPPPPPSLSIDAPRVTEGAPGTVATLRFTVTLSAASVQQVTVDYADAGTGTATSGEDYTALAPGTLTFAPGTTARTIDVSVTGDAEEEPDETVVVVLSSPVNATLAPGAATGTGTIADDEAPTVSVDSPRVAEGAPGATATLRFTVSLSAASAQQVTVDYADAGTGTATSGTDYTALPAGTLTFAPGTTARTIDVSVTGDAEEEPDETVVVALSSPVNATLAPGAATGTGTIADDDEADLRVETGGPGTTTRTVNGHTVTVVVVDGVPAGVVVALPSALDRDLVLRFAPPAAGVPLESARFGLGESAGRRTVVDVTAQPVPSGGLELCLPVGAALRAEAGERGLRLLHYRGAGWAPVAGSRDEAADARVCASGVTALSPFAAGYDDLKPTFGEAQVPPQRYREGTEIDPLALPAATGGDLPLTYALTGPELSGTLPEGLAWTPPADAATGGTLAGTPTMSAPAAAWTLTATDTDGDTATLTFTLEVEQDLIPTFGEAQVPPQRYREGTEIDPLALPAATGGNAPLAYTLAPALPEGLEYTAPADATSNAATGGTLTGTPEVPAQAAAWTLTATDTDGDTATLTFTLEVEQDLKPTFGEAQVPPQRYVQGLEIDPLALPAATGGDLPLTYALTGPVSDPALPEGLAWSEAAVTRPPRPGTLAGTPTVPAPESAWTLSATDADGDRATLRFTLEVLDRLRVRLEGINAAILPDLSRAMTASTMDAVSGRIGQALSPGGAGPGTMAPADLLTAFAGLLQANEQAVEDGTWSWRQGLDGRRFALALSGAGGEDAGGGTATGLGAGPAPDAGAGVTLWGAGDYRSLSGGGEGSAVDWDGHLFGAHLGMDARFGAGGLAGLALSVSEGRFDYTDTSIYALGETVEGEYESRMTSAHPYVGWTWPAGRQAWASLGYGRGEVTLTDGEAGRQSSESRLLSAAAGGSVRVLSGEGPGVFGPMTVDLKGEAWTTRLEVDDNGERIAGLAVRTHRLRGAVEGARAFALAGGAALTPSVELGIRFDGGDGETGAGVELGGGLDYAHPASSLSADLTGRVLLAHEGATDDWSVGGALRLEPASGRGLSLRLAPSYGDTGSGLARLWEHGVTGSGAGATGTAATGATGTGTSNDESPAARLDTEMGYGLAAFAGVLTPYGGLALSEGGARGYRLGARFRLGPALELGLEGERRESRTERTDHGLMLRGQVRW